MRSLAILKETIPEVCSCIIYSQYIYSYNGYIFIEWGKINEKWGFNHDSSSY